MCLDPTRSAKIERAFAMSCWHLHKKIRVHRRRKITSELTWPLTILTIEPSLAAIALGLDD